MENKVCTRNVIKSKIMRPDFFIKLILCIALMTGMLSSEAEIFSHQEFGTEKGNLLMYLLMVFTSDFCAYYCFLIAFAILVSDIVYEEYLTKNVYVMYGSRKKAYIGMLKLTAVFSFFLSVYYYCWLFL